MFGKICKVVGALTIVTAIVGVLFSVYCYIVDTFNFSLDDDDYFWSDL